MRAKTLLAHRLATLPPSHSILSTTSSLALVVRTQSALDVSFSRWIRRVVARMTLQWAPVTLMGLDLR